MKALEVQIGQKFNRLTIKRVYHKRSRGGKALRMAECMCDCGNPSFSAPLSAIVNGGRKSCGCLRREIARQNAIKAGTSNIVHGECGTRLYRIWRGMRKRCYDKNHHAYLRYGGRGIFVCDAWNNSFVAFSEWAHSNGYQEHLTLERIDNDKEYSPNNCTWATRKVQNNNRSSNKILAFDGISMTQSQWAEAMGLTKNVIHDRLARGWTIPDALTTPIDISKRNHIPRPSVKIQRLTEWDVVLNEARKTMGFDDVIHSPSSEWKRKILLARHSPIRGLMFRISIKNLKYWISVHFCRHTQGITHFVQSQRDDRVEGRVESRENLSQSELVKHDMVLNAESIINISKKRLCKKASVQTQQVWRMVVDELREIGEVELAAFCKPECWWCGNQCPEIKPCGMFPPKEMPAVE